MDAKAQAALAWLTSELSHVEQQVLRQPYPEIKYPRILPVDTSAPDWANSVEYKTLDFSGDPESYSNHGGDIPLVEIAGSKRGISVHQYALGYTYSMQDIEQAQYVAQNSRSAAINILAEKANGTRQLVEHFMDRGFMQGIASTDQIDSGLVNDPDVALSTTGDFLPGGTDKTIDAILAGSDPDVVANELLQLFNQAVERVRVTQTNTIFRPTHILLPPIQLGKMRTYRIPNTSETLITYLERVINVTFEELINLQGQGEAGTDRMMVYTYDTNYVKAHLPRPFMLANPVQTNGFNFRVDGMVRMGGTDLRVPKMHLYVDGV
jgi:hypothetical protein